MREPPTASAERKWRKVCYVRCCGGPLTLTHSTLCLQALKGTTLHPTTFLSVGSKREDLQSMLEIFLGRKIDTETSICGVEPLLLARSLNWSSRAVCSCLVARAHHSQRTSATYARSSAGPRIHYLDAPQTQPSSARLQRQQAGRGRLKPGVRQKLCDHSLLTPVDS